MKEKIFFKKVARNERMINNNNLFFKTGGPIIKNFDFLKRFGTLYDLLLDLLHEEAPLKQQKNNMR